MEAAVGLGPCPSFSILFVTPPSPVTFTAITMNHCEGRGERGEGRGERGEEREERGDRIGEAEGWREHVSGKG